MEVTVIFQPKILPKFQSSVHPVSQVNSNKRYFPCAKVIFECQTKKIHIEPPSEDPTGANITMTTEFPIPEPKIGPCYELYLYLRNIPTQYPSNYPSGEPTCVPSTAPFRALSDAPRKTQMQIPRKAPSRYLKSRPISYKYDLKKGI